MISFTPAKDMNGTVNLNKESPLQLPLTDPRDAEAQRMPNIPCRIVVIKPFLLLGLTAEHISRRWVWSTVVRRPSEVYDTHRWTKLTAPATISRSRDMVGAHQNLNGSRDLTPDHAPFRDGLPSVG